MQFLMSFKRQSYPIFRSHNSVRHGSASRKSPLHETLSMLAMRKPVNGRTKGYFNN
uniref:Uncharacterized protein n=1 Tax=Parascaris univalens TaxID=6257 RepID=A0A914ZCZ7_PARUN